MNYLNHDKVEISKYVTLLQHFKSTNKSNFLINFFLFFFHIYRNV